MSRQARHFYEFGPFRVDAAERRLLRDDQPVPLQPKDFDTLLALVSNSGHLLKKEELLKTVWPDSFVEENNLTQRISALRKALGGNGEDHTYIETIPRVGYRFAPGVREILDEDEGVIVENRTKYRIAVKEEEESEEESETRGHGDAATRQLKGALRLPASLRPRVAVSLLAGAALVGLVVALLLLMGKVEKRETSEGVKPAPFKSIAVLPFKQLGGEAGDEYFGLGMADVLITRLSNIRQIIVRPTSAVLKYSGQAHDPVAAGRELSVDSVLEGSVHRAGEQIRVTVRLVSVRDGAPLWAEKFDAKFTDIFKVQDSISEQVARALMLKLSSEEQVRLMRRYTENTEAYQAYLKGRYFWNKRTEEGFQKGIEYFQQAIDLDSNYALAHAGLADSYTLLVVYGVLPPRGAMTKARTAALRALEIDDKLAEAHTSLAHVKKWYEWDFFAGPETEYKRAIELNPNYATAYHWYGLHLAGMGRFDEAVAEMRRSLEIDPLSLISNANLGWILYVARQYDEAIEQLQKTLEMDPNFARARVYLGRVYLQKGMYAEAIRELQKAMTLLEGNNFVLAALGHAYGASGRRDEAQRVLDQLRERSKREYISAYDIARIYTGLGDKEQALRWLERAYEDKAAQLIWLKVDPQLDSLRSDLRFTDLLRRMNLAP
ncbi:MAG TPA: tetratricopeptide repeat protein [Pyrinomonadaceae bacterium]